MRVVYAQLPPLLLALAATLWITMQIRQPTAPLTPVTTDGPAAGGHAPAELDTGAKADFRPLAQWRLFGAMPVNPGPSDAPLAVASATSADATGPAPVPARLKLSLRGILFQPHSDSLAIIRDDQGRERGYRIGDTLPGAARISAIESRRVLVRRQGRLETLRLPHTEENNSQAAATGESPRRIVSVTVRGSGIRR